ncbi:MAG: hypothetical protein Q8933_12835 [Bacteroidota bacterium]|nr:hypothetical protein [Bacteroidota bacterium]MDP4191807.1 hypothetical protein [Bacteroidota bacterium]MDP4195735.1 hypothetical protein [Bacteroidota bacterium]
MNEIILNDAKLRPDLFLWNGALDAEYLQEWIEDRNLELPEDMVEFWKATGGGNVFESEELLGPTGAPEYGVDFDATNEWLKDAGMPDDYIAISSGSFLGAIRLSDKKYVLLDSIEFDVLAEYDTLDELYQETIRAEFASQYDM